VEKPVRPGQSLCRQGGLGVTLKSLFAQCSEFGEFRRLGTTENVDILLSELERSRFEAYGTWGVGQHEAEIDVNDVYGWV